jgi:hypothetical protein
MAIVPTPTPIPAGTPNEAFYYNQQLARLFQVVEAITLTQDAKRAIANGDKAGNLDARYIVQTSGAADAQNTWAHGLKRIPLGYIVCSQDKAGSVYIGTTAWDTTNIYLRVNVATVALILLVF